MMQKVERPQLVANPFVIYIGVGLIAILLQLFVPLPFI